MSHPLKTVPSCSQNMVSFLFGLTKYYHLKLVYFLRPKISAAPGVLFAFEFELVFESFEYSRMLI